ncbi:hypothetical protein GCM10009527_039900 [Actinomadura nitritigenes]|uniref:DUF3592 domain-containing protein n=1 Tax=Actinomadura nitritigenes TaxID=134602 RepID=A0ABS3QZB2_9ACTN|nr:hypothetical protein [Actinomadura nitritigenes]MBO2439331.1 hypothetical protein [Actinomadura nitritigenes]
MKPTGVRAGVGRLRRRIGFDGNELRRDVDRRQRAAGLLLLLLFLGVGPPVCWRIARNAYDSGVRAERYEAATRHEVDATVLKVDDLASGHRVTVTWREPGGQARTGSYDTWYRAVAGEHLKLWAGPAGASDVEPRRHARTVGEAVGAGLGAATTAGIPVLVAYLVIRRRSDVRRDRLWDAEWERLDADRSR